MKKFAIALLGTALIAAPTAFAGGCGGKTQSASADSARYVDHHEEMGNIVETAQMAGSFETLIAAAVAADLGATLADGGPFTVFAPTDGAFAALPEGTVDSLLLPENKDTLAGILTYHVVPGSVFAADLAGKVTEVETVGGGTITIDATGETITVNGIAVSATDVKASNGVIHVINGVLMPQ